MQIETKKNITDTINRAGLRITAAIIVTTVITEDPKNTIAFKVFILICFSLFDLICKDT